MALRDRPAIERALDRLDDTHPVIAAATRAVTGAADRDDTDVTRADVPVIMEAVRQAIAEAPTARAEVNVERWWENRYIVSILTMGIGWILNVLNIDLVVTSDLIVEWGPFIQAVAGWIFARAASVTLPPINWWRPWTILGIWR